MAKARKASRAAAATPTAPKRRPGRPDTYSPELAAKVLEALQFADGGLEEICERPGMPAARTVYRWLANPARDEFRQEYLRARETQGHVQAERGLREALEAKDPQLGRLKWDARRWAASKLAAKYYGERQQLEHTGPGGGALVMAHAALDLSALTAEERRNLLPILKRIAGPDEGVPAQMSQLSQLSPSQLTGLAGTVAEGDDE